MEAPLKIALLIGSHPRHLHVARAVASTGLLAGVVIETREAHVPAPPEGLRPATRALFVTHFERREAAEHRFFGAPAPADFDAVAPRALCVATSELNGPRVEAFLRDLDPDLVLSFGVHYLAGLQSPSRRIVWNIHGGLSPWYRGTATHFWPSYLLAPQMTGVTLHEQTPTIHAGAIIHQRTVSLHRDDGLHDVAARCVSEFAAELPLVLAALAASPDGGLAGKPQGTLGKLWRNEDWRPDHLHVIYDLYGDRVVAHVLDGGGRPEPTPFRAHLPAH
jgi:hypothetical protein